MRIVKVNNIIYVYDVFEVNGTGFELGRCFNDIVIVYKDKNYIVTNSPQKTDDGLFSFFIALGWLEVVSLEAVREIIL